MTEIRKRIETFFEIYAGMVYHHRIKVLLLVLIVVGLAVTQLPKLELDTSNESFLHKKDPILLEYNQFREEFGQDEMILAMIEPSAVFDISFFEKLKAFHEDIENTVPYLDEVTSLINARHTQGKQDELVVEDLMEEWPETPVDVALIRKKVFSNPLFINSLISQDGKYTTVMVRTRSSGKALTEEDILSGFGDMDIPAEAPSSGKQDEKPFLTQEEIAEVVSAVDRVVKRHNRPDFRIYYAGSPVVTHFLKVSMLKDIRKFMIFAIATITIILFLMFRRITGVILPLLVVIFSLVSTLGIMAFLGVPMKLPTQILPSFLIAVGIGDSVHILAVFYLRLRKKDTRKDALIYAVGHSGLAVLMTTITTAAGLMSFSTAEVAPIAELGIFAGVGVILAMVYTLVLLPAAISLIPVRMKPLEEETAEIDENGDAPNCIDRILDGIAGFSVRYPVPILIVSFLIFSVSVLGMTRLEFSHYVLKWLPETSKVRQDTEMIDRHMRGSITMEAVIDTGRINGWYDPVRMKKLDTTTKYLETLDFGHIFVGKALALSDIVKETHRALNENRDAYYQIPDNRQLIAQELLLFENSGSDDMEDFTSSNFEKARITIRAPFEDAVKSLDLFHAAADHVNTMFSGDKVTITGMMSLFIRIVNNAIRSMAQSYVIAIIVITILMILLIGNIRIGLLSMIPNLFPIIFTMGIMGWFNLPLDLFTMMVGSIAIGLAVDDTIHFFHNFRRYLDETGNPKEAVLHTLHTTGRAMLVTTLVLSAGFFVFIAAAMNNVVNFGLLTGITIIMALAADYFIAPALLILVNKQR